MTILDESEGKFIIWANYVQNIKTIINKLKEKYGADSVVSIFGEVSTKDRQQATLLAASFACCMILLRC